MGYNPALDDGNFSSNKKPMIYYFSPDIDSPAGGVRVIYNHVDVLNKNGIKACVLHSKVGFRCTWFANQTPIAYCNKITMAESDFLVMPEIYFHLLADLKIPSAIQLKKWVGHKLDYYYARILWQSKAKKIIFNQNAYHTFLDFTEEHPFKPAFLKSFDYYFCISDQNKRYLDFALPNVNVKRLQWSLPDQIYGYDPSKKRKRIAYMPRKNADHAKQVLHILQSRGHVNSFEFVPIQGMNQLQVAETLKSSSFFLSFGYPEGLPLPPAEAMACGCIVIGYHGGGGEEYFKPEFSYAVPFGEILLFAQKVEQVLLDFQNNPLGYNEKMKQASKFILENYGIENETKKLISVWKEILHIS